MPQRIKTICNYPGCSELVDKGYCEKHRKERDQGRNKRIDSSRLNATDRGYDSKWKKYRINYLRKNPLCVKCLEDGRLTPANVVDHVIPHRGNKQLFWDYSNHQALCKQHHDIKTATEDGRFMPGAFRKE